MSRIATWGYEVGLAWSTSIDDQFQPDGYIPNATSTPELTLDTTIKRSGTASLKVDCASGVFGISKVNLMRFQPVLGTDYFYRCYLYFTKFPTLVTLISVFADTLGNFPSVGVNSAGQLRAYDENDLEIGTEVPISLNTWYRVEQRLRITSANTDEYSFRVNGVEYANLTGRAYQNTVANYWGVGVYTNPGTNGITFYVDDCAINDSTGSAQTSYPGEGKVVLSKPIGTSQAGSWTGGAGGAATFGAVDNTPPAGLNAETDASQIESADSSGDNTTDEFRVIMQSYTTAGVGASDTISVVEKFIVDSEDISTGTKNGKFGLVSNPADASGAGETFFTYGNDTGPAGNWPTEWACHRSAHHNPTVTKGTSPIFGVRKTDTATRVATVCFMGLYIEYVPPAGTTYPQSLSGTLSFAGSLATFKLVAKKNYGYLDFNNKMTDWKPNTNTGWSTPSSGTLTHQPPVWNPESPADTGFTHLAANSNALTDVAQLAIGPKFSINPNELVRVKAHFNDSAASGFPFELAVLVYNSSDVLLGWWFTSWGNHSSSWEYAETTSGWLLSGQAKAAVGFRSAVNAVTVSAKAFGVHEEVSPERRITVKNISGALSFLGALTKRSTRFMLASVGFSGALSRSKVSLKSISGTLSFAGALLKRTDKTFAGSVGFSGAISAAKRASQSLAGTLSFSGAMTKSARKALAGSVGFSGATSTTKFLSKALSGSLSFAGAISKMAARTFTASVGFSGALSTIKSFTRSLAASLGFSGALVKHTSRTFTASVGFTGALTRAKQAVKALSGSVSFAGALLKRAEKNLSASVGFTGLLSRTKVAVKTLSGALSFSGVVVPRANKAFTASVSFAGAMQKRTERALSGAVSFTGALSRGTSKALSGSVSFAGTLARTKVAVKDLAGALSFSGAMVRRAGKSMVGSVGFSGAVRAGANKALSGSVSFAGTLVKRTSRLLGGGLSFTGNLSKLSTRALTGAISFSGALSSRYNKFMAGAVGFSGALSRRVGKTLFAAVSFVGSIGAQVQKKFAGALSFAGSLFAEEVLREKFFTAAVSFSGSLNKMTRKTFTANLSFSGALNTFYAWLQVQATIAASILNMFHWPWRKTDTLARAQYNVTPRVKGPIEMAYKRGTNILFTVSFTTKDGVLFDPDPGSAKMYVKTSPAGVYLTGHDRATGGRALVKIAVGEYEGDWQSLLTDTVGRYEVEFEGFIGTKRFLDSLLIQLKA